MKRIEGYQVDTTCDGRSAPKTRGTDWTGRAVEEKIRESMSVEGLEVVFLTDSKLLLKTKGGYLTITATQPKMAVLYAALLPAFEGLNELYWRGRNGRAAVLVKTRMYAGY